MEPNDTTFTEMQRQMQQLRDKLEDQKIVNERILRNSCRQTVSRLKIKSNVPIIAGVAALLSLPAFHYLGFSDFFLIFTAVMMLVCIAATVITNRHIPRIDRDLVTATEELTKFRKINAEWIKVGLPMLVVWLGILAWEVLKNLEMGKAESYAFLGGVAVGVAVGAVIGLKLRRDILDGADDLMAQIKDLKE